MILFIVGLSIKKYTSIHGRREHKLIVLNKHNQPIGPSKAVVNELGSFLGTLARNATLCPLNKCDWRKMDIKEDMWAYTKVRSCQILIFGRKYSLFLH